MVGTVPLGGKPETGVTDGKGNVYVNIEDRSEIVRIDTAKLTVAEHYPMAGCDEPSALAFDVAHRRLFAGCASKIVAVVDPDAGKLVTTVDIGGGVDAGAFNPKTQQIFMSCGDGVLTVIHEDSPEQVFRGAERPHGQGRAYHGSGCGIEHDLHRHGAVRSHTTSGGPEAEDCSRNFRVAGG